MTTSSRRIAVLCAVLLLGAPFLGGGMSSARAAYPTLQNEAYFCPYEGAPLAFEWTRPMPYNGWLGDTDGFTHKAVQAYGARLMSNGWMDWGLQAQDGSFVCRMHVAPDQRVLSFVNCRPNANWPVTLCYAF